MAYDIVIYKGSIPVVYRMLTFYYHNSKKLILPVNLILVSSINRYKKVGLKSSYKTIYLQKKYNETNRRKN